MLEPTRKILPNWALAGILGGFVIGTYVYSIRAVGDDSAQASSSLKEAKTPLSMNVNKCLQDFDKYVYLH